MQPFGPGFRFNPTDEELVQWYLKRKITGKPYGWEAITQVDFYNYEPWELPSLSPLDSRGNLWFFFVPRGEERKRLTRDGQWKGSGATKYVFHLGTIVGEVKNFYFKWGEEHTQWRMKEYSITGDDVGHDHHKYVICKLYYNGPWNENQFVEEEWVPLFDPPQVAQSEDNANHQSMANNDHAGNMQIYPML